MSRSGARVLTILAYTDACLKLTKNWHTDDDTVALVDAAQERCFFTLANWPVFDQSGSLATRVRKHNSDISAALDKVEWVRTGINADPTGMCYVAMQMIDDLLRLITNKQRRGWLETVHYLLTDVINHIDPDGSLFFSQDQAAELTAAVYSVTGEE